MSGCSNTLLVLDPSCEAIKKKGGFDKTFFIGSVADLSSVTISATGEVETIAFTATKGFKKITGKRLKHGAGAALAPGEVVNMRTQSFNSVLYAKSAAERWAVEQLADAVDVFIVAESNAGTFEIFGLANDLDGKYDNYGLSVTAGEWKSGVLINDDTSVAMTFSGDLPNAALIFDESETVVANLATLDALVV
tara:strand:- start:707 stop:1285 length:579 start_codon:yes stop_codon:yes gene_type:complete